MINGAPLEDIDKKRIKGLYQDWLDIKDQRSNLNRTSKDIREETAKILNIPVNEVNMLFTDLEKEVEEGKETKFSRLYHIVEDLKS